MTDKDKKIGKILVNWHESMVREKNKGKKATLLVMAINNIRLLDDTLDDIILEMQGKKTLKSKQEAIAERDLFLLQLKELDEAMDDSKVVIKQGSLYHLSIKRVIKGHE